MVAVVKTSGVAIKTRIKGPPVAPVAGLRSSPTTIIDNDDL